MDQKNINREVSMEEVKSIILDFYKNLDKNNIHFNSVTSDDAFFEELQALLEKHFDHPDYKNYN
jgi:hypothetical protein